eukprot:Blabericola_migrator_1__4020@NODE_2221_length_3105_cov_12_443055_g1399_i0_p2_GENE_NODE_2221_length_3105_cov_12_443055_g1399_i0NODE_2221_length_3105_cov_12_443055_g1399_i0_p2_ORF_typecomplete_len362_score92_05DUF1043/PF06295_12/8_7e03DUF1043/PF06295_12/0_031DUF2240/PF09999_9/0_023Selenoprotein_S/PF06936_11/1_8e03Selenoprotein_S/PF06936_11/0_02Selenoprotein_S/PF06936_11/1_8e04Baculo_PEP_C/PF04513_12/0_15Baculo_PEP_C/PF04513_12/8_2e03RPN7/PF10602_9/0_14RPN7/PF10602_9/1_9e03Podoplanin/PF05808_11/2_8
MRIAALCVVSCLATAQVVFGPPLATGEPARMLSGRDGRAQLMKEDLNSPRHRAELKKIKAMNKALKKARHLRPKDSGSDEDEEGPSMDPPLAPSFERLQSMVDDVSRDRPSPKNKDRKNTDPSLLPCLLRVEGCKITDTTPKTVKQDSHSGAELKKTQASIEKAVTKLQKDLDMRTAEVVKEIERRAAEMRREIVIEAEQLIEAVKYLVTMLADSVTRADEMGEGFVREWYDEAEQRYVGGERAKPLDEEISSLDADMKKRNPHSHSKMVENLKESVKKTREKYGAPDKKLPLDDELGLGSDTTEAEVTHTEEEEDDGVEEQTESTDDAQDKEEETESETPKNNELKKEVQGDRYYGIMNM